MSEQTNPTEELEKRRLGRTTGERDLPFAQVSNRFENVKALGVVADHSACGYYRVILPFHLLRMHGAQTDTTAGGVGLGDFWNYDMILFPRQTHPEVLEAARYAAWEGKTPLFEIDDDLSHILPSSPAYSTYHQGSPEYRQIPKFLSHMFGFTTTTMELAKWYYQYNRNARVVENFIDLSLRDWNVECQYIDGQPIFKPLPPRRLPGIEEKIVIGWQGGGTHWEDLERSGLGPALKAILERYPQTVFAMYCAFNLMEAFVGTYGLPKDRVFHIPARHFVDHPSGLHGVDIALAPIMPCQFNLCKSHLKLLEGMAAGAAMVCSNVGPYARFERRHPGSVLTVGSGRWCSGTWYQAIERLVLDSNLRRDMQVRGRQLIVDAYSMEKNIHLWPAAWFSIVGSVNEGVVGLPPTRPNAQQSMSWGMAGANDPCPCGSGQKYKKCCKESWG